MRDDMEDIVEDLRVQAVRTSIESLLLLPV
jgi:hypothetical protein